MIIDDLKPVIWHYGTFIYRDIGGTVYATLMLQDDYWDVTLRWDSGKEICTIYNEYGMPIHNIPILPTLSIDLKNEEITYGRRWRTEPLIICREPLDDV